MALPERGSNGQHTCEPDTHHGPLTQPSLQPPAPAGIQLTLSPPPLSPLFTGGTEELGPSTHTCIQEVWLEAALSAETDAQRQPGTQT